MNHLYTSAETEVHTWSVHTYSLLLAMFHCVCVTKKKRESYRETKKQMGLLEAWISRHGERSLMCRISIFYVSNLRGGVCLTREWLINLSSAHLTSSLHILTRQVFIQPWWTVWCLTPQSPMSHQPPPPPQHETHMSFMRYEVWTVLTPASSVVFAVCKIVFGKKNVMGGMGSWSELLLWLNRHRKKRHLQKLKLHQQNTKRNR